MWEKGDPIRSARSALGSQRTRPISYWGYQVSSEDEDDNSCGTPWLERLIAEFAPRANVVRALAERYNVSLVWIAEGTKYQSSFIFPPDLVARIADLGCSFTGEVLVRKPSKAQKKTLWVANPT